MTTTAEVTIDGTWTQIAEDTDERVLASWFAPLHSLVAFAATATNDEPVGVGGHVLHPGQQMLRDLIGDGFLWARLVNGVTPTVDLTVSK